MITYQVTIKYKYFAVSMLFLNSTLKYYLLEENRQQNYFKITQIYKKKY